MRRFSRLPLASSLVAATLTLTAHPSAASTISPRVPDVTQEQLMRAAQACRAPSAKAAPEAAQFLALPSGSIDPTATCSVQVSQWDYIFNLSVPTPNGSKHQLLLVYTAEGASLGTYYAENLPLRAEVAGRTEGRVSQLRLSGQGEWLEQKLQWSGLFRLEDRHFIPIADHGRSPEAPRCPNDAPVSLDHQNGIHRRHMWAKLCPEETCYLGCEDSKNPEACHHTLNAYWIGAFSQPGALEVLVNFSSPMDPPGLPVHGSHLFLLQVTQCGYKMLGSLPDFVGDNDSCKLQHVGDRDVLLCQERRGPSAGHVVRSALTVYGVRGGELRASTPVEARPSLDCQARTLVSSTISDVTVDEPDGRGVYPVTVTVDSGRITRSPSETCEEARARLQREVKTHTIGLELSESGIRLSDDAVGDLQADPIPGLFTYRRLQAGSVTASR